MPAEQTRPGTAAVAGMPPFFYFSLFFVFQFMMLTFNACRPQPGAWHHDLLMWILLLMQLLYGVLAVWSGVLARRARAAGAAAVTPPPTPSSADTP